MTLVIDWICGNCPVQAEGTIDGEPFYFRARGNHWSFEVLSGDQPEPQPVWGTSGSYGREPYEAGWMSEDEARAFIKSAAQEYQDLRDAPDDDGQPDEMTEWRDYDPDC